MRKLRKIGARVDTPINAKKKKKKKKEARFVLRSGGASGPE